MPTRTETAQAAAAGLRTFAASIGETPALIGFDGFVDAIIAVVDKRHDTDHYDPVHTLDAFGQRIVDSAGRSSNVELVTKLEKLGGNGPIMANAMATAGFDVTYIGNLGEAALHPVFNDFAEIAKVHSIADPGHTDALEFDDGKLMLGKHASLRHVNQETIDEQIGRQVYVELIRQMGFIGMVNWTMLTRLNSIWEALIEEVLPEMDNDKVVFIDLADPSKRTKDDIAEAMELTKRLNTQSKVVVGFNLSEAAQVADVLGVVVPDNDADQKAAIEQIAIDLREALEVHCVCVHPREGAAAAIKTPGSDTGVQSAIFKGPFVAKPKLSTGAGDNFNAGFCLGLLAGLPIDQCLCTGTATSGFYVRNAHSPSLDELAAFCDDLPAPE
ncbi:MAG: PfkB family carbohydrate kinase [Planctomycetota bacterium]